MLTHSLDRSVPAHISAIPSHYGKENIHHNDVLKLRAAARRMWKRLQRKMLQPHFPNHRNARLLDREG